MNRRTLFGISLIGTALSVSITSRAIILMGTLSDF